MSDLTPERRAELRDLAESAQPFIRHGGTDPAAVCVPAAELAALLDAADERDRLREDHLAFTTPLGFGDGVTEPAATLAELVDLIHDAMCDARDHFDCPRICEPCGEPLACQTCDHCHGSGCGPGTVSGAYEECGWCAGAGKVHPACVEKSYADLADERDRLRVWQERVALAAGIADEVEGRGVHLEADPDIAAAWMAELLSTADDHAECPVRCDDHEREQLEWPLSCPDCRGSGLSGPRVIDFIDSVIPCDTCGGDGRDHTGPGVLVTLDYAKEMEAVALDERDRLAAALARAQGPFTCCSHCEEDAIHDVETNAHEVPCTLCQSSMGEVERLRGERDRLAAQVERVRALAEGYSADARDEGYGGELWSTTASAIEAALDGADDE